MISESSKEISDFIRRHQYLLLKERDAELEQSTLLLSNCPPKLLEQRGLALVNLGVANIRIGLGGRSLVALERPAMYHSTVQLPEHSFRPGDIARIEAHSEAGGSKPAKSSSRAKSKRSLESSDANSEYGRVEGVIYKVSDVQIVVAVDEGKDGSSELSLPQRCRLVKLVNMATFDRMEKMLDILKRAYVGDDGNKAKGGDAFSTNSLSDVLLGVSRPSAPRVQDQLEFYNNRLNASQKDAVKFSLSAAEVACIHGPPGTGKTHTLVEIIRQLIFGPPGARDNEKSALNVKLLVCGASNLSVDNILERILKLPKDKHGEIKCTRIGHPARVMGTDALIDETLDAQVGRSDQAGLARDVKRELEDTLAVLNGKMKPRKLQSTGLDRRKMWESVRELRKEYRKRERVSVQNITNVAQVIFATCHSAGGRMLSDTRFDVVIIDEATQALEAVCWIPILKGRKLILAGDPMQLPPTILSRKDDSSKESRSQSNSKTTKIKESKVTRKDEETEKPGRSTQDEADKMKRSLPLPESLELTLFERLEQMYGPNIKRMLQIQYRMHKSICAYPTKALYNDKLISDASVADHLLIDLAEEQYKRDADYTDILGSPVVFFDTSGCEYFEKSASANDEGSKYNENEGTLVKSWLESLISKGIRSSQIAIITPYQAQVSYLSNALRPSFGQELEIGSVDGMQGREKEAVILSLVRSNEERAVGFLKDTRRLNVAMTRARRQLCVIADASTIKNGGTYLKNWMDWLEANADVRYGGID